MGRDGGPRHLRRLARTPTQGQGRKKPGDDFCIGPSAAGQTGPPEKGFELMLGTLDVARRTMDGIELHFLIWLAPMTVGCTFVLLTEDRLS